MGFLQDGRYNFTNTPTGNTNGGTNPMPGGLAALQTQVQNPLFPSQTMTPDEQLRLQNQGLIAGDSTGGGGTGDTSGINMFQPDLYPTTSSASTSGVNWDSPFLQALLPQLQSSISAMPGILDNYERTVQDQQANAARQMLGPQAFQGTLNDLASRGILNSSVAGSALANTAKPIMQGILDRGYDTSIAAQTARLNYPTALSQIANLGQGSASASQQSNPLAPYELASQMLLGLQ